MSSLGPNSGTVFSSTSGIGDTAWSNPGNAAAVDSTYATCTTTTTATSQWLVAKGFNLLVPGSATGNGILVELLRSAGGSAASPLVIDNALRLVKAGVIQTTDKASATHWPGSDTYASYGGSSDLWGDTWVGTDFNSGFGVALSAKLEGGSGLTHNVIAQVDHIRITVTYTYAGNTKSVSASMSLNSRKKRGIGKFFSALQSTSITNTRGSVHQFVNTLSLTVNIIKGLSLTTKSRVALASSLHNLRASAARQPRRRLHMWTWVIQELEEDDWTR